MIVVKIELYSAVTGRVTTLGRMHISNDGVRSQQDTRKGEDIAQLFRKPTFQSVTRETKVENWPRLQKTVWQLLKQVLDQIYV